MLFKQNIRAEHAPEGPQAALAEGVVGRASHVSAPEEGRSAARESQGHVLIVGQGISLKGEITACDRLVVEGHVEVSLNDTRAVEIRPSGRFIGSCEVEEAEISGIYEGELTVRERLVIRASGRATGKIQYGEIELERGGRIAGELSTRAPAKVLAEKMVERVQAERPMFPPAGHKVA